MTDQSTKYIRTNGSYDISAALDHGASLHRQATSAGFGKALRKLFLALRGDHKVPAAGRFSMGYAATSQD